LHRSIYICGCAVSWLRVVISQSPSAALPEHSAVWLLLTVRSDPKRSFRPDATESVIRPPARLSHRQFPFFPAFCGKSPRFDLLTEGTSRQNLSSDERFVAFRLRLCYTFAHNKVSSSQPRCPELAEKQETLLPSFISGREKTIKPTSANRQRCRFYRFRRFRRFYRFLNHCPDSTKKGGRPRSCPSHRDFSPRFSSHDG
jgi:hypothetical protein